jgi:hypothetical protein
MILLTTPSPVKGGDSGLHISQLMMQAGEGQVKTNSSLNLLIYF